MGLRESPKSAGANNGAEWKPGEKPNTQTRSRSRYGVKAQASGLARIPSLWPSHYVRTSVVGTRTRYVHKPHSTSRTRIDEKSKIATGKAIKKSKINK